MASRKRQKTETSSADSAAAAAAADQDDNDLLKRHLLNLSTDIIQRVAAFLDFEHLFLLIGSSRNDWKAAFKIELERNVLQTISSDSTELIMEERLLGPCPRVRRGWTESYTSRDNLIEAAMLNVPDDEDEEAAREELQTSGSVNRADLMENNDERNNLNEFGSYDNWSTGIEYENAISFQRAQEILEEMFRPNSDDTSDSDVDESESERSDDFKSHISFQFRLALLRLAEPTSIQHACLDHFSSDEVAENIDNARAILFCLESNKQKFEIVVYEVGYKYHPDYDPGDGCEDPGGDY